MTQTRKEALSEIQEQIEIIRRSANSHDMHNVLKAVDRLERRIEEIFAQEPDT
jgi:polyhydroxyalkanoate synthesis regulator phasin